MSAVLPADRLNRSLAKKTCASPMAVGWLSFEIAPPNPTRRRISKVPARRFPGIHPFRHGKVEPVDLIALFNELFFDYTLRTVAMGAAVLGIVSGALGSFAVLRKQSLLGDAMSHAALPGVVLAFLLTGSKAPLALVVGAAVAGWVGTLLMMTVIRYTRIKPDAALGI